MILQCLDLNGFLTMSTMSKVMPLSAPLLVKSSIICRSERSRMSDK